MIDKREECECDHMCCSSPHEYVRRCIWPGCLSETEKQLLFQELTKDWEWIDSEPE